jgi:hypothetical protein
MSKQLIALRGSGNVGKTTTLHALYRLLVADPLSKTLSYQSLGRKLDFEAIIQIGGHKVGLVSRGDIPGNLKQFLDRLVQARCEIIVCAARTKGEVGATLASFDPPYQLIEVEKVASTNETLANVGVAHQLASLIYLAIKN